MRVGAEAMRDLAFLKASSCVSDHTNAMPSFMSILSGWISALRFLQYGER